MTEDEWRECDDPWELIRVIKKTVTDRKRRLLVIGFCKTLWPALESNDSRRAVEIGERCADGLVDDQERLTSLRLARTAADNLSTSYQRGELAGFRFAAARAVCLALDKRTRIREMEVHGFGVTLAEFIAHERCTEPKERALLSDWDKSIARSHHASLVRDIFGNPFRPVTFDPAWRTDTALALARQAYEASDFAALPILADALQDAGCDSPDLLAHLRDASALHVRGCWALDLVCGLS